MLVNVVVIDDTRFDIKQRSSDEEDDGHSVGTEY